MNRLKLFIAILFLAIGYSNMNAQVKTNYEIVEQLIELSIQDMVSDLNLNKDYVLKFTGIDDYLTLESSVLKSLQEKNIKIVTELNADNTINYSVENINLHYSEIFKDGLFGSYLVNRNLSYKATYFTSSKSEIGEAIEFNEKFQDSIFYSDLNRVQNLAYNFTYSELPEEPFFSSSFEPVIAIGTAAVAVYLLFNLRSK